MSPDLETTRKRDLTESRSDTEELELENGEDQTKRIRLDDGPQEERAKGEFAPGAVVRVHAENFLTYKNITFQLGDSLNMVIGPNGVGKSTFIASLCLGLMGSPSLLGRAKDIADYIQNGQNKAYIEIELKGMPGNSNMVVGRTIERNNDGSKQSAKSSWFINGRKESKERVKTFVNRFNVQVDNLCQFLPQEKVADFAKCTPQEVLLDTERAIGDSKMIKNHERLKELHEKLRSSSHDTGVSQDRLDRLKETQTQNEERINRIRDRSKQEKRLENAKYAAIIAEYEHHENRTRELEKSIQELKAERQKIEERNRPIKEAAAESEKGVKMANRIRTDKIEHSKKLVSELSRKIQRDKDMAEKLDETKREIESMRKQEIRYNESIRMLRKRLEEAQENLRKVEETPFDEEKYASIKSQLQDLRDEKLQLRQEKQSLAERYRRKEEEMEPFRAEIRKCQERLMALKNVKSQMIRFAGDKLRGPVGKRMVRALEIYYKYEGEFGKGLSLPPIFRLKIKRPESSVARQVANLISRDSMTTFTVSDQRDMKTFDKLILGAGVNVNVTDISIHQGKKWHEHFSVPIPRDGLKELGFDCYLIDLLDGPDDMLFMLCSNSSVHNIPIAFNRLSSAQEERVKSLKHNNGRLVFQRFVDPGSQYQLVQSRYGHREVTQRLDKLRDIPQWFSFGGDKGSDEQDKVKEEIEQHERELEEAKAELKPLADKMRDLEAQEHTVKEKIIEKDSEKKQMGEERNHRQKLATHVASLQDRYNKACSEKPDFEDMKKKYLNSAKERRTELSMAVLGLENTMNSIAALAEEIRFIENVTKARLNERDILGALSTSDEAELDQEISRVKDEYRAIERSIEGLRNKVQEVPVANIEPAREIIAEVDGDYKEVQRLVSRIEGSLRVGASSHENTDRLLREFETRADEIQRLEALLADKASENQMLQEEVNSIQSKWEPELDSLIAIVSERFGKAFSDIGCQGRVKIGKPENFKDWSIDIEVSFRKDAPMQRLTGQRQSGGERAVSTVLYLMALQEVAKSPFRAVDEINQGMDPVNERMVHNRMVDVSCQGSSAQYFLVTPKLLTNLKTDERMKTHVIFSGKYVSRNKNDNYTSAQVFEMGMQ
ncbi:structural maintenance of chromosomes protein 5 [Trichomonascus vanleenenianus]|uniref:DNA repair ATPase SMC5 n=1 Tax=Trichomonascus vanleenenianus TaxID=2268995 RepID=UPI003EC9A145